MIGFLEGQLTAIDRTRALVSVGGVGYWVSVSASLLATFTVGEKTTLYIHTHVREDAFQLYGFLTLGDLRLFENLISVSGVGPKLALNVFSAGPAGAIKAAIENADPGFFTAVSGIGKKSAQRLIIDLKGKTGAIGQDLDLSEPDDQLRHALVGFGFSKAEIEEVTKKVDKTKPLEEQLRLALKLLS